MTYLTGCQYAGMGGEVILTSHVNSSRFEAASCLQAPWCSMRQTTRWRPQRAAAHTSRFVASTLASRAGGLWVGMVWTIVVYVLEASGVRDARLSRQHRILNRRAAACSSSSD